MHKNIQQELQSLTAHLSERQDAILEEWEKRVIGSEGKSTELAAKSRKEFQNNIPNFLERMYNSLQGKEINLKDIGKEHGAHRWEHGFDLQQTIREWGTLNKVLVDEINALQDECNLHTSSLAEAHRTLSSHIQEGIEFSVKEFDQLRHREAEVQFRDLEEALEEPTNEIREKDLRNASHDLKGMAKNLQIGFSLLEDEKLNSRVKELIDPMSAAADGLEQLLNDLLDLFRLETNREEVNVTEFNAAKVLTELCESVRPTAKKESLELKCGGTEQLPVKIDQKKVERIVRNLLLNALKYTKEGYVEVHWKQVSDDQWMLQVIDTGPGLDATHAESLSTEGRSSDTEGYEKYPTADRASTSSEVESHGEGIGLLIVRHLCKLLDGIIDIETEAGVGTTFKITFPLEIGE